MAYFPDDLHDEYPRLAQHVANMTTSNTYLAEVMSKYLAAKRLLEAAENNASPANPHHVTQLRETRDRLREKLREMLEA